MTFEVREGDCVELMAAMPAASVDAVVCDPPYGLEFMGKDWDRFAPRDRHAAKSWDGRRQDREWVPLSHGDGDPLPSFSVSSHYKPVRQCENCNGWEYGHVERGKGGMKCVCDTPSFGYRIRQEAPSQRLAFQAWCEQWAIEALRVLKPGGHLLAFGGTRTYHRLVCAVEDAGFEIRDTISWLYGSGFPKSLNVGAAIDKQAPRVDMFAPFAAHYSKQRQTKGLTHAAVCAAVGAHGEVNHGGASVNWERGYGVPTVAQWAALAPLLGLADEWLPLIERVEAEREVLGVRHTRSANDIYGGGEGTNLETLETVPATPEAERWEGWGTALKPAHEPVVYARKPLDVVPLDYGLVNHIHHGLAALICLLSSAYAAARPSTSSPADTPEATCVSAHARVYLETLSDESARTDTFKSQEAASIASSIASSWSAILDALLRDGSRSTTATESEMTTALRILSSCLSPITSVSTMPKCGCLLSGQPSAVDAAEQSSSDEWVRWTDTLERSALGPAFLPIARSVVEVLANVAASLSSAPAGASSAPSPVPIGPATTDAESFSPAHEPVVVARKPLSGTVASNCLEHGTGALNIDGTRVGREEGDRTEYGLENGADAGIGYHGLEGRTPYDGSAGRWPANVVLSHTEGCVQVGTRKVKSHNPDNKTLDRGADGGVYGDYQRRSAVGHASPDGTETVGAWSCTPDCPVRLLDEQTGETTSANGERTRTAEQAEGMFGLGQATSSQQYGDTGGASRFFYVAKASRAERNAGLEGATKEVHRFGAGIGEGKDPMAPSIERNVHPTVKPISLMRWLVRLVTPPNGTVLDPFAGSGTTGCAAVLEGFDFIGLEREPEYVKIAEARIAWWHKHRGDGEAAEILAAGELRDAVEATGQLGMFD